jgi:hypothetical protein
MVYDRLNRWEALRFHYNGERMMVFNPSNQTFYDLVVHDGSTRIHLKEVPPKGQLFLERKG